MGGSRRSSLASNNSSTTLNNFLRLGKKKGSGGGKGGFDDEEEDGGKDFVSDPAAQVYSFEDLSSIADRGRYGAQAHYQDTAPIIPTLASPSMRPSGNISNTQYRKQMTAMKKQVFNQAGKPPRGMNGMPPMDPRSMSMQTMRNPYNPQDPRLGSFTGQQGGPPPPGFMNNPRANSMSNVPQQQFESNGRAYSLQTSNPYQQQKQIQKQPQQRRGYPPQQMQPIPQRGPYQQNNNHSQVSLSQQQQQQQQQPQQQQQMTYPGRRISVPKIPSPLKDGSADTSRQLQRDESFYDQPATQNYERETNELLPKSAHSNHHFLADNVVNSEDNSFDNSNHSEALPNDESTPTSERNGDVTIDSQESPSKLPRSKGLPRLSLLSMKDDDDDIYDDNTLKYQSRPLEPVQEKSAVEHFSNEPLAQSTQQRKPDDQGHSKGVSLSSMSAFSTTSDYNPELTNSRKLYQLSGGSHSNEVFVTASQFNFTPSPDVHDRTETGNDFQEKQRHSSMSSSHSMGSLKNALKSPKFLRNWSKKKTPKNSIDEAADSHDDASIHTVSHGKTLTRDANVETLPVMESRDVTTGLDNAPNITTESKKMELTVDQLGVMQESTYLIRELNLVSSELAASVKREIALEEKLNGVSSVSNSSVLKEQDYAIEIARLVQEMNNERQKRFIAEEHVLLMENGTKPSMLELSYENEKLKSQISMKDELIAKQSAEIEQLSKDEPDLRHQLDILTKKNKELESITIPKLKNEIEVLSYENKKVTILSEKVKILRNEKLQLEKMCSSKLDSGIFNSATKNFSADSLYQSAETTPVKADGTHPSRNSPLKPPTSPFRNMHRPPSFNLINITASTKD